MPGTKRHRHNKVGGKSFIILPIIFFLGIYLILFFALSPTLGPLVSAAGMVFSDSEKDYSTEYNNIFVPVQENDSISYAIDQDGRTYISEDLVEYPQYGTQFGEIIIDDCGVDSKLFFGDGDIALRNGVGVYNGSFIPGYGKTTLIAGHNNTYFNGLKNAEADQEILIRTSYGDYRYSVTETAVKKALDTSAYDLGADYENLILYTCYPFDEIGLTSKRFYVYAELIDGPLIKRSSGKGVQ